MMQTRKSPRSTMENNGEEEGPIAMSALLEKKLTWTAQPRELERTLPRELEGRLRLVGRDVIGV